MKQETTQIYLFDWGDTLMVDRPGTPGKMCDWDMVETIDGAKEALEGLSKRATIYIATGANDSTEDDIKKAFDRVELSQYISGFFCKANIGFSKGSAEFLPAILDKLDTAANRVAMVGDNLTKDINPALAAGIRPIWFTTTDKADAPANVEVICDLRELL